MRIKTERRIRVKIEQRVFHSRKTRLFEHPDKRTIEKEVRKSKISGGVTV